MASEPLNIDSLPNEILHSILSVLSTPTLLSLAPVNRRFHVLILHLLHQRLVRSAALPDHKLTLECYHPVSKRPYQDCDYLGTDGLDRPAAWSSCNDGQRIAGSEDQLSLAEMNALYSRFQPVPAHVAIDGSAAGSATAAAPKAMSFHDVHLDECELFSQLCTFTNLVKAGPKRGLFYSHVGIGRGLIRVWRDWLAAQAVAVAGTAADDGDRNDAGVLWADAGKNVGLRLRVVEMMGPLTCGPALGRPDEDLPVSYRLEYEELLVRTSQLLLKTETSDVQEGTSSGCVHHHELPLSPPRRSCWRKPSTTSKMRGGDISRPPPPNPTDILFWSVSPWQYARVPAG